MFCFSLFSFPNYISFILVDEVGAEERFVVDLKLFNIRSNLKVMFVAVTLGKI